MDAWRILPEIFLRIIQPNRIHQVLDQLNLDLVEPSSFENITVKLSENSEFLVSYTIGYIVVLALGLLLFFVTVVTGLTLCICRTFCGKCGSIVAPPSRDDASKRLKAAVFLFILCIFSLPPIIFSGLSNNTVNEELKQGSGFVSRIYQGFIDFENYKVMTLDAIKRGLNNTLDVADANVSYNLMMTPHDLKHALISKTDLEPGLIRLKRKLDTLELIETDLNFLDTKKALIAEKEEKLRNHLIEQATKVQEYLKDCSIAVCLKLKLNAINLVGDANILNTSDVTYAKNEIKKETVLKLKDIVKNETRRVGLFGFEIQRKSSEKVVKTRNMFSQTFSTAYGTAVPMMEMIKNSINFTAIGEHALVVEPILNDTALYRYIVFLVLTLLLAVTVVLFAVGLCLGGLCKPPEGTDRAFTTRRAADTLLAAVSLYLISTAIIMIACMFVFAAGGLFQNEICRYLRNSSEVRNSLQTVEKEVGAKLSKLVQSSKTNPKPLDILGMAERCGQDQTLFQVLNLESYGIDVMDGLMNIKQYGVDSKLARFRSSIDVNFRSDTLIDLDLKFALNRLAKAFNSIKFQTYDMELRRKLVNTDLDEFINDLRSVQSHPKVSRKLSFVIGGLPRAMLQISNIKLEREKLKPTVSSAKNHTRHVDMNVILKELATSENAVKKDGHVFVEAVLNNTATAVMQSLLDSVHSFHNEIRYDIGHCRPGYDAVVGIIDAPCVDFLQPFNVIWLSLGMCVMLLSPGAWLALVLAGLYRKERDHHNRVSPEPGDIEDNTTTVSVRTTKSSFSNLCKYIN